ncbi:unnamed protein product [Brassica rapa]|uniref:Uncharacterized protein n=2 Tax=Brassica TaxID=3705 RepID=A0A3P6AW77_BRACM|nr:unnamed protein product [Brassica napus]CAG7895553.1 unnamed protein product [Brassica rapa]CDY68291.1 BnaAnng26770D [Brassica napus]VDC92133.1 unnamed protein product [Brassica rapa]
MLKTLQTRLPPISRKKKRRGDIRAYISRGDSTSWKDRSDARFSKRIRTPGAFSRHISELKAIANSEVAGSDVDLKISSFQAVLAHMWRSIIRKSGLNPEEVTHCNMRQRLNPPIGLATATTTAGEMLNNGLG